MAEMTPYATAKPLFGALPSWIADEQERQRIGAYALYEQIYWTVPETFKLVSRGTEDKPIYIPSGRQIVETMNRYVANGLNVVVDPAYGSDQEKLLAQQVWDDLAKRERFYSGFNMNKRYGIIRGDWFFHIYADPAREPGSKISIMAVDPASVFPIYSPDNVDILVGYHIAEQFTDNDGKQYIRRLTYRKTTGTGGPSPISMSDDLFEVDKWGGPGMEQDQQPYKTLVPESVLPSPIDDLPLYHVPNFQEPGTIWGSSEMRGLERVMAALNQSISDEELSLALDGLGLYATDAGTPVDDDGEDVAWNLGPGRVVELPDGKVMKRVSGVTSVSPFQDHMRFLIEMMDQTLGISAVAKGKVSVEVAESGIALALELAPLLSTAAEKEQIVTDVLGNMLHNVGKWYVAYEGGAFNSLVEMTRWVPVYGPKIPTNRKQEFDELMTLAGAVVGTLPIVSGQYVRLRLRKLGYDDMPDETGMMDQILAETQIAGDMQGSRVDAEVEAELSTIPAPEGDGGDTE